MNDDRQIMRMLGAHRDVVTAGSPSEHFDVDVLSRHATGQLSAPRARAVSEHLLVCDDGRCLAFVRSHAEDVDAAAAVLYPAVEAEMHARTFLCREALWQTFEEIAREQGAPIDDVLSEAMRSYARQRSYGSESADPNAGYGGGGGGGDPYDADQADLARTGALRPPTQRLQPPNDPSMRRAPMPSGPPARPSGMGMPPPPMSARGAQRPFTQPIGQMPPPPPSRGRPMPSAPPPMRAAMPQPQSRSVPPPPRSVPPPLPPSDPMLGYGSPRGRTAQQLTLSYNGQHFEVSKERFVLGRSKTQADLVLEDPNVSRQHAAIERVGNEWVLADLGSTNGCYIDGQRVSRRPIADGDVIEITTHQIHCTLR